MSPSERKAIINPDRTDLSLTKQCKLLKISRSSLYYAPIGMNAETLELMNEIDRVFTKYPFFGSRQIAAYLPRNGFHAGRHRVRRLMGVMGLQAIYKGPNTRSPATHACMCERGQEASSAPDLSLSAPQAAHHASKLCLVR
jgi:putative transposase